MPEPAAHSEQPTPTTVAHVAHTNDDVNSGNDFVEVIEELTPLPPLIHIQVSFYSISTQALIDNGAAASFICLSILRKLPYSKLIEVSDYLFKPIFRTEAGDIIQVKGVYRLCITLSHEVDFSHHFFVLEHLPEGCILGKDFLHAFGFTIEVRNQKLSCKHKGSLETLTVSLTAFV